MHDFLITDAGKTLNRSNSIRVGTTTLSSFENFLV